MFDKIIYKDIINMQSQQFEWHEQWSMLQDNELFLFQEWIDPFTLGDFRDKEVLEGGCGGGQHTHFIAPYAKHIIAIDLNTIDIIAKARNKQHHNITFLEADIATMELGKKFDVILSIGVIHHTDDPEKAVDNLKIHLKEGGILLLWVYSEEGNWMVKHLIEPLRKVFLCHSNRKSLLIFAKIITIFLYLPIYSLYLLPLPLLPYYEYFQNFRKLSFYRNTLNVFDKLNAPQVDFISFTRAKALVKDLHHAQVSPYKGVSWRISGIKA
ncbi:MAG: class I SAM-dependent methyltransferase [Thioploca sp.]|nr:class I SAM-dependent methyltransferase [Thioploca sp.]